MSVHRGSAIAASQSQRGHSSRSATSVVAIGASAGGLDACRTLLEALPPKPGVAFILVQHQDPNHDSLLVELLSGHTRMTVGLAEDGAAIEANHLYIIPPGTYIAVNQGALAVTVPTERHGARLPLDFLLQSLANEYGPHAACIILSGTGSDGSIGLAALKAQGGLVIVQDPEEAEYDGMPRNAVLTQVVDAVLPIHAMPAALAHFAQRMALVPSQPPIRPRDWLAEVVALLRERTNHNFSLYKQGTLRRRVARRMAMAKFADEDFAGYLDRLQADQEELDLLAKDLLINVTAFFRDTKVFDALAEQIIPAIVDGHTAEQAIRIWVAGCSTGEETYSLVMLFRERIAATNRHIKLQVFASDIDADAVATAREGLYPHSIEADVSPERLARFFSREADGYRFLPDLRAAVVFAVQDVLADPPFSRLDMVSCRNLLIYLRAEAQAKVISLFHFALRPGGVLLLGGAEAIGNPEGQFEVISKPFRMYRQIGRKQHTDVAYPVALPDASGMMMRAAKAARTPARAAGLAELCRRLIDERFAPAAVLINQQQECLFSLGPTDRYLRIAPGHPTVDLPSMARQETRIKLRAAIQQARQRNARVIVAGGRITHLGEQISFNIDVQPVLHGGEPLLLICFVEAPKQSYARGAPATEEDLPRIAELEHELDATRVELRDAIRNLEISGEEQKAVNEEALSVNEEFQSTNEELLTSKEELQSLNEELNALNSQLHETLDRQRITANDLQNVLYSTDVATLFLDAGLNIRFFTPATRALFNIIPGDVGRPLADLNALAPDAHLLSDARRVLKTQEPVEAEVEADAGRWFVRRILPYRTQDLGVEGVVITFSDITERRHIADALRLAKRDADLANTAKSRFLAAASHDLRQPLQTLTLLQGLLAKQVAAEPGRGLIERFGTTLDAMSGMLNSLLDTNRIEAGTVSVNAEDFPVADMLARLDEEFSIQATARGIVLKVMPCSLSVRSDPRLLEQIVRNLLSNAIKYTTDGKVLLGCRRQGAALRVEIWDTGVGIPAGELHTIFEEYHQLDNAPQERNAGLGLGLSIVKRLAGLLGHPLAVRSNPTAGSVFTIEVPLVAGGQPAAVHEPVRRLVQGAGPSRTGAILVVEDDTDVRQLLELSLRADGYAVTTAPNSEAALLLVEQGRVQPDLILVDFNLPHGTNGVDLSDALRRQLKREIPIVVLTGDISTETLRTIASRNVVRLSKPVHPAELAQVVQRLLPPRGPQVLAPPRAGAAVAGPTVYVIDDDAGICDAIRSIFEGNGRHVQAFLTGEAFFAVPHEAAEACVLIDAYLPGMSGFDVLHRLAAAKSKLPTIMITGNSDVSMAVDAMKAGAMDFIEKPFSNAELVASVERALERARDGQKLNEYRQIAADHIAGLTPRQYEIMTMVLAGHPSKNIAADLHISQRTVENHRAAIMKKTGTRSLPALARLAITANASSIVRGNT